METTIINAIARTLFVNAYAQHCEDGEYNDGNGGPCEGCELFGHTDGHPQPGGGERWEDYAPETPPEFVHAAHRFVGKLEQSNGAGLLTLVYFAAKADGLNPYADDFTFPEGYVEGFGSDLAMMHLGTGVSWFDDHNEFDLDVPQGEGEIL